LKSNSFNVDMLNDCGRIKKLFFKYNTTLLMTSRQIVLLLNECSALVIPNKEWYLHDDTIEYQILLKINKNF